MEVEAVVAVAVEEIDLWRVRSLRFLSRLDLTLPMHETFGDDGSVTYSHLAVSIDRDKASRS